ncbi:hypothetical protein [Paenarthrobacter nitroguajacolicus]|uniref:hypothetical protein n=1 Tax=Paenarthrobacter nitroguajacolicus TaxID=211146 RepID=UPI0028619AFF|nr:hypothetical protein [Paenarthrobacter nitroguajacolicus]MDR6637022.1 hypothetical protein [Paenarthrobacter nitroguajacolicus]
MLAHDGSSQPCSEELVHALAVPLACAENYLAGVRIHTLSMGCQPDASDNRDFRLLLSVGIQGAISDLERAATIISAYATAQDAATWAPSPAAARLDTTGHAAVSLPDHSENDDRKGGR